MIAEIKIWTEYGKEYSSGVNFIPGTEAQEHFVFAHSAQDALEWFKKYPLFADAIVDDMQDGRFVVTSKWFPHDNTLIEIEWVEPENELMRQAKYFRQRAVISPRNTIYENVGFNPREGRD